MNRTHYIDGEPDMDVAFMAMAEVGLAPDRWETADGTPKGTFYWHRELTEQEFELVDRAFDLSAQRPRS